MKDETELAAAVYAALEQDGWDCRTGHELVPEVLDREGEKWLNEASSSGAGTADV